MYQEREEIVAPQTVLLEVSYHGIHVIDKRKKDVMILHSNKIRNICLVFSLPNF